MARLGELERAVMDALWDASAPLTANELRDCLAERALAQTTMLTVLSRLEAKGFVAADGDRRPKRFSARRSRADHTAELMLEVLGSASDREAALARFVDTVTPREADTLRRLLG
ncbi:BlaI/MecI/CopY family transcriptional regulator [Ruicaihuangia caeni]|uniref:BlaI/MecI/CopY family transcriptional regulator n=1 Tax=Ruicaihuangia caeni TaxID=3042517 RepID=A0AAW6T5Z1_9MICO|nr:BlaI/MecI/CopY family transcriptional regulator [Klugiella sp. YN-L-19]MDI2097783.1 BlaI/MecI/CopY family transcriptional regulator [Klugiella sp. YN-L-19]